MVHQNEGEIYRIEKTMCLYILESKYYLSRIQLPTVTIFKKKNVHLNKF